MLREFAASPPAHARLTLVSTHPNLTYSGMVPGLVAGRYAIADCVIALAPLAARANAVWLEAGATAIDAAGRTVTCTRADGSRATLPFDVLSIDTGGTIARDAIPGAARYGLFVRPIERFVGVLTERLARPHSRPRDVVVVGAGIGGVELAMALRFRLGRAARISLVSDVPLALVMPSRALRVRVLRALRQRDIVVVEDVCAEISDDHVVLRSAGRLACDAAVVAIGVSAPPWLQGSGLALDAGGFVATGAALQSLSHPPVFAAGDVAARADAPRPRSGVYAVRAGPPLAHNLRNALGGAAMVAYRPQRRSLNLVSCGDRHAIAAWGDWSFEGRWVGSWKDRTDRRFVRAYSSGSEVR